MDGDLQAPPHWRVVAHEHYQAALQEATRRGISRPIALIRAVQRLRDACFVPPHLVRVRSMVDCEIEIEKVSQWPLPGVDWNVAP